MADRYIPEHRRSNFKAKGTFKPDELRRRREEQQVEIRKQKREENLAKRRNMSVTSPAPGAADSDDEGGTESQVCLDPFPFDLSFVSRCMILALGELFFIFLRLANVFSCLARS
jgi:hypothetical protein